MGRASRRSPRRGSRLDSSGGQEDGRRLGFDAALVPSLLLLIARDLLVHDPPRILAWRLLHDPRLAAAPSWLTPLLPRMAGDFDRDPLALLLGALATGLAAAYLAAALFGARPLVRAILIGLGSLALVVGPSAAFVGLGLATGRPYGQDGGVVQLPLAIDRVLAGESPYGADYSDSILGKESRASAFWAYYGGNPILHHHAYLPGTHLLMMPAYLASRATLGVFDPRGATLLFYAIAITLAVRLANTPSLRLAAAAVVALNPLVYWHQIFGANDAIFAALLLGAVQLAQKRWAVASGIVLGLACATKQLAWPFAPFLLLHLSGARSFRDLLGREAIAGLLRPALAAAAVFVVVVAPVAALDFRAFYGDIVAYNVGLPGGDNYPLGGTPGFGLANFLIYFGRVSSLRDYFPFGVFYLVLVPVGLLLARVQLRDGRAPTALLTGSAALLAALYLSRVVHPNYLIGAALLLPVALLATARPADLAVVPLLLLGLATEVAEHELFRTTWDQAVAVRLPAHLTGVLAAIAPRAGPQLTRDPVGVLVSAVAAGLAVLYLIAGACGASARVRSALAALAVAALVAAPTLVVVDIGERTGTPRTQDAWVVQTQADAGRLARAESPYTAPPEEAPAGREAWATSFRLDPPRLLTPDRPLVPPGASVLAGLLRPLSGGDPRRLALLALGALLALLARLGGPEQRPLALAAGAVPFLAVGVPFGARDALPLAALVGALMAARGGRALVAGALAGFAGALDHRALLLAPFLVLPDLRAPLWRRVGAGCLAAYAALVLPVALLDLRAFAGALAASPRIQPGVGLANLLFFKGGQDTMAAHALFAALPLATLLISIALTRLAVEGRASALGLGALTALLGLWLAPAASPEAMSIPVVLALLAVLRRPGP